MNLEVSERNFEEFGHEAHSHPSPQRRSGTMENLENTIATAIKNAPWNKGKLTGAKPPLRPKHVWSIRTKLQLEGNSRDLAMFNSRPSTASCVGVMSLPSGSRMLL